MKHIPLFCGTVIVSIVALFLFCGELPQNPIDDPNNAVIHLFTDNRNPSVIQGDSLKVGCEIKLEQHISSVLLGSSCGSIDTLILPSGSKLMDTIFTYPVFDTEKPCTLVAKATLVKSEIIKYDTLIVYVLPKDSNNILQDTNKVTTTSKDIKPSIVDAPSNLFAGKADTLLFVVDNRNRVDKLSMQLVTTDGNPLDSKIFTVVPSGNDTILIAVASTVTASTGTIKIGIATSNGTVTDTSWYPITFVEQNNALWNTLELPLSVTEGKLIEYNLKSILTEIDGVSITGDSGVVEGTIWKWTPAFGAREATLVTITAKKGDKSMNLTLKITVTPGDLTKPELSLVDTSLNGKKVGTSQIQVACIAKDSDAGVGAVTFTFGGQIVKASKQSDSTWSGVVSGLKHGVPAEITVTAIDKSIKKNAATLTFAVTYDSTLLSGKAPVITTNLLQTLSVNEGESLSLKVDANSTPEPTYQWYKDNVPLEGKIAAEFSKVAVSLEDAGVYHVVVSNGIGTGVSSIKTTVTVAAKVTITANPDPVWAKEGESVSFTVKASGEKELKYQWSRNGEAISGATSETYKIDAVTNADDGKKYACTVSNSFSKVTSTAATLSVSTTPVYAVKFDVDGGSPAIDPQSVKQGEKATKPSVEPTKTGFAFAGWYSSQSATTQFDFSTTITTATTIVAKWEPIIYEVTFNSNGGSDVQSQKVQSGEMATKPAEPTKSGYNFAGWYTSSSLTTAVNFTTQTITADCEFFAKWESILYTVTFNSNGGSDVQSQKVQSGGKATEPAAPTKSGYNFAGWYTSSSLATSVNFTTQTITADCEFFAKWEPIIYTVTFNSNDGSTVQSQKVQSGGKATEPAKPTRSGYNFAGWYTSSSLTTVVNFTTQTITADCEFFAKWDAILYTVKFNSNGGSEVQSQSVQSGGKATEPAEPTKSGNTFAGWYTSSSLTTAVNFTTQTITADCEFFAKWEQLFTLTYSVNGGTGSVPTPEQYKSGETVTIKDIGSISKTGNKCLGWGDGTNTYNKGDQYKITGNVTLYAVWEPIMFTVKFNSNGGSEVQSQSVQSGGKATEPTAPTKSGNTFAGWYTSSSLTTAVNFSTQTITANCEFFAKWNPVMFTVKFNSNGGSEVQSQSVQSGRKATEPTAPTKSGNTFAGWYTSSSLTTAVNFSTQTITADCEFFAKWEASNYTISYYCPDGSAEGYSLSVEEVVNAGETVSLHAGPCGVPCKELQGYSYAPNEPFDLMKGGSITPKSNIKLYAVYQPAVITVKFDNGGNGASGTMPSKETLCGSVMIIPECTFTPPPGKKFRAWSGPRGILRFPDESYTLTPPENEQWILTFTATWNDL